MDYTTVPRSLIYRERRSLEEFGVYEKDSITRPLADSMLRMVFIQQPYSENLALWCLNTAFYICTMFLLEKDPRWRIGIYKQLAAPKGNLSTAKYQNLTLSLVVLLLDRLLQPIEIIHPLGAKALVDIYNLVNNNSDSYIFSQLNEELKNDSSAPKTIPNSMFAPRVIDKETVYDVMREENFSWVNFTNYFEERSVRDIVNIFGSTEEEKRNVVDMLRQASHGFYTAGFNDYLEKVDKMLDDIDEEIYLRYSYDPEFDQAMAEAEIAKMEKHDADLTAYEARIKELEAENERLNKENEELKEIKKIMDTPLDGIEAYSKVGLTEILKLMENDGANFEKSNNKTIAAKALMMMTGRSESACKQIFSSPLSTTYSGHKKKISELNGYLKALGMKTLLQDC